MKHSIFFGCGPIFFALHAYSKLEEKYNATQMYVMDCKKSYGIQTITKSTYLIDNKQRSEHVTLVK